MKNEKEVKELLQKVIENQEEIQETFRNTETIEEGLELPHPPDWLMEALE